MTSPRIVGAMLMQLRPRCKTIVARNRARDVKSSLASRGYVKSSLRRFDVDRVERRTAVADRRHALAVEAGSREARDAIASVFEQRVGASDPQQAIEVRHLAMALG